MMVVAAGTASEAEKDSEDRLIPPFSPSLELARSLGSSPVTPQGTRDNPSLENPQAASAGLNGGGGMDNQFTEDTQVVSGDSEMQYVYDRPPAGGGAGVGVDRNGELVDDEDDDSLTSLADLPMDEEGVCPPNLSPDLSTWRRSIRVVRATLPHQVQ